MEEGPKSEGGILRKVQEHGAAPVKWAEDCLDEEKRAGQGEESGAAPQGEKEACRGDSSFKLKKMTRRGGDKVRGKSQCTVAVEGAVSAYI